ncbi:ROK family transcriptional regulator [Arsenicibacter rosenii]|nr:ROK family transcriptional regulator [Arsenicibacter rosenii]
MEESIALSVVDAKKNKLKRRIIDCLYREGKATVSQLARLLHTSVPSVATLLDELTAEQWLHMVGTADAQYGRKPTLYSLNAAYYAIVVIDIRLNDTKLALFSLTNELLYKTTFTFSLGPDYSRSDELADALADIAREIEVRQMRAIGVGVAVPGLVDGQRGVNYTYQHLDRPELPFRELIRQYILAPTYLINDSKAIILGEHWFGLARAKNQVISVNIDWGVGIGVITGGRVLQGASGFAGELGHIQVQENGELCLCGKVGCLDTLTGASALIRRARTGLDAGQASRLAEEKADDIDVETIINYANAGDGFAVDLLTEVGMHLGKGLSIAVHLFNPELIIVNGVLAKAEKLISRPIEQAIAKYCLADFQGELKIEISQLGSLAKMSGTQAYVLQSLLEQEQIP